MLTRPTTVMRQLQDSPENLPTVQPIPPFKPPVPVGTHTYENSPIDVGYYSIYVRDSDKKLFVACQALTTTPLKEYDASDSRYIQWVADAPNYAGTRSSGPRQIICDDNVNLYLSASNSLTCYNIAVPGPTVKHQLSDNTNLNNSGQMKAYDQNTLIVCQQSGTGKFSIISRANSSNLVRLSTTTNANLTQCFDIDFTNNKSFAVISGRSATGFVSVWNLANLQAPVQASTPISINQAYGVKYMGNGYFYVSQGKTNGLPNITPTLNVFGVNESNGYIAFVTSIRCPTASEFLVIGNYLYLGGQFIDYSQNSGWGVVDISNIADPKLVYVGPLNQNEFRPVFKTPTSNIIYSAEDTGSTLHTWLPFNVNGA